MHLWIRVTAFKTLLSLPLYILVQTFCESVSVCLCLLSNNFHISLILKGQKLLGSQQWADSSWLNMHLIPFGLVSVSKPPTFLSHNHSYRFSNQLRPRLGLRWLLINSCQLPWLQRQCGLRGMFGDHTAKAANSTVCCMVVAHRTTCAMNNNNCFHLNILLIKPLQPQKHIWVQLLQVTLPSALEMCLWLPVFAQCVWCHRNVKHLSRRWDSWLMLYCHFNFETNSMSLRFNGCKTEGKMN